MMKTKNKFLVFLLPVWLIPVINAYPQVNEAVQLSPRIANYDISVSLDTETKILTGSEILYWQNRSDRYVSELRFHLYMNAFKNSETTFFNEGSFRGDRLNDTEDVDWGWVNIKSIKSVEGVELSGSIKYLRPEDGNQYDQTVISIQLFRPVPPKKDLKLFIEFETKLPKIFARTGYYDNFYLVGQWFPKIGVYETAGMRYAENDQWNCHQFHTNTEFYSNFGNYEVEIRTPENYKIGATGKLIGNLDNGDGTRTFTFIAEDVVDFAWTASPMFKILSSEWKGVEIKIISYPEHAAHAKRHLDALIAALDYFERKLGKYPYPSITVVIPPLNAAQAGGMEYPMFITSIGVWGLPSNLRLPESVTVHEFGHQYFMGILASNEFEEAWLDEGFNTYFEGRIMDETYGSQTSILDLGGFRLGDGEMQRVSYVDYPNPKRANIARNAWEFRHGGYGTMTYQKTATWLNTLEGICGADMMDEIFKTYYDRWKFRHPSGKDFIEIANEIAAKYPSDFYGSNLNWFFDQMLYGTDICDYQLSMISNNKITAPAGIFDSDSSRSDNFEKGNYHSVVRVNRRGEVLMPVETLIHFDNNDEVLKYWDGKERSVEFEFDSPQKIVWAKVDPDFKLKIDFNLMNNSKMFNPGKTVFLKYAQKALFWLENFMLSFSMLF